MTSTKVNQEERAFRTWGVLTKLATTNRVITYEELAKAIGTHHRAVRYVLELIQRYCMTNFLPPLTILVVNKSSNEPGAGFIAWDHENLMEGRAEVRGFDWTKEANPYSYASSGGTEDELVRQLLSQPDQSEEVYAKVKVRGTRQMIFRTALLRAYDGCCAITGISFENTLDAAHVIPWSECTSDLKMDPRNGILMLCCHHRLFDQGVLSIDEDYKIVFVNKDSRTLTEADQVLVKGLHGRPIILPRDKALWPSKELIRRRNGDAGGRR